MAVYQYINCATRRKSVLTFDEKALLHAVAWEETGEEASHVLPGMLTGCAAAGIRPEELAGVTVVHGPGSFTGLRVAVTVVNMLVQTFPQVYVSAVSAGQMLAHIDGYTADRYVFAPYASDVFLFDREGAFLERVGGAEWESLPGDAGEIVPILSAKHPIRIVDLGLLENHTMLLSLMEHIVPSEAQIIPFYAKGANITTPKRPPVGA